MEEGNPDGNPSYANGWFQEWLFSTPDAELERIIRSEVEDA